MCMSVHVCARVHECVCVCACCQWPPLGRKLPVDTDCLSHSRRVHTRRRQACRAGERTFLQTWPHLCVPHPHPLSRLGPRARLLGEPSEPGTRMCLPAAQALGDLHSTPGLGRGRLGFGEPPGSPPQDPIPPKSDWASSAPDAPLHLGVREPQASTFTPGPTPSPPSLLPSCSVHANQQDPQGAGSRTQAGPSPGQRLPLLLYFAK